MKGLRLMTVCMIALMAGAWTTAARAQESVSQSALQGDAFGDFRGTVQLNLGSGDGNAQVNAAALALNDVGAAISRLSVVQRVDGIDENTELHAITSIDDDAFANARGMLMITQGSGRHNAQANLVTIALGLEGEVVVEAELNQSRSTLEPTEEFGEAGIRQARIGGGAFRDASGIIQVNAVAGTANTTYNRLILGISADALR